MTPVLPPLGTHTVGKATGPTAQAAGPCSLPKDRETGHVPQQLWIALGFAGLVIVLFIVRHVWRRSVEAGVRQTTWWQAQQRERAEACRAMQWMREPSGERRPTESFWREALNHDPRPGRPTANIFELARRLGVEADYLRRFIPAYREAVLPKRRGGTRTLHVPDEPTKKLQRKILHRLLFALEPHPAAIGFRRGKSIVDHAALHSGCDLILKCDIVDFFGSTLGTRVNAFFRRLGWDDEAAAILIKICCRENALPQGAPTSPALSNLVNRGIDRKLAAYAASVGMTYSRYADDLCFSYVMERSTSARRARGMLQYVRRTLKAYGYTVHGKQKDALRPQAPPPTRLRPRRQRSAQPAA